MIQTNKVSNNSLIEREHYLNSKHKLVCWDLFGGGGNSVYKALKNFNDIEIYTFDITKPTRDKHFKVDLSQNNIIDIFAKYPRPDIIVASPLCQSFSSVLSMKGGGTAFWRLNDKKDKLVLRTIKEFNELKSGFTKNLNPSTQLFLAKLGRKCIDNTIKLIEHYKPKYWYIENPKSSLMWKYIKLNKKHFVNRTKCHFNIASYGRYGFLIRKDTIFCSNVKMNLLSGTCSRIYHVELEEVNIDEVNKNIKKWPKFYLFKNGKWYKRWYVTNGHTYKDGPKYATLFAKDAGLGKLQKIDDRTKYQKIKKSTEQICESGSASHIPSQLIKDIFLSFGVK